MVDRLVTQMTAEEARQKTEKKLVSRRAARRIAVHEAIKSMAEDGHSDVVVLGFHELFEELKTLGFNVSKPKILTHPETGDFGFYTMLVSWK